MWRYKAARNGQAHADGHAEPVIVLTARRPRTFEATRRGVKGCASLHASFAVGLITFLSIANYRFAEDQRLMPKGSSWPSAAGVSGFSNGGF